MERIPILRMGEFLLVTIQVELHDQLALKLQDDLTLKLARTRARGVLIDISALEIVDSFIGRSLAHIAAIAKAARPGSLRLSGARHCQIEVPLCLRAQSGGNLADRMGHGIPPAGPRAPGPI